ncbi:MAG: hypothetical protein U9Q07_03900 [Planctomycetota bacterium]|nr:hypothetical protein [Planctomycetota bacterium]
MTMIKWKASSHWRFEIERVEVVRETDKCVFVASTYRHDKSGERRHAKVSQDEQYFDTWTEAKDHLLEKAREDVERAHARLVEKQDTLQSVESLVKP